MALRVYRSLDRLPPDARGAVIALGNFDGLHRGHQALLKTASQEAKERGVPCAVMTFEPHPRSFFHPQEAPFRLTPFSVKARLLKRLHIDVVYACHFNQALASCSATDFVHDILLRQCGIVHGVVGTEFAFGRHRQGSTELLSRLLEEQGVGLTIQPVVTMPDGAICSSTAIRQFLRQGHPEAAQTMLGRPWSLSGCVVKGDQRGRRIGTPTANIRLGHYIRPAFGVYAVRVRLPSGAIFNGVANIGRRPTVGGNHEYLEVHLLDTTFDLYHQKLDVDFLHFIRPEKKFDGLDALVAQIARDIDAARAYLAHLTPVPPPH